MTLSEMLLPEFDEEMIPTRITLERVPADKFTWKPHEKSMTLVRLATHVAELPSWAIFSSNVISLIKADTRASTGSVASICRYAMIVD